jgi:DNA-binding beta-propeller fold protein YncE
MQKYVVLGLMLLLPFINGCMKNDKAAPATPPSGFPAEVGKIINTNCSVSGCHNSTSKDAAGGLAMDTWDNLFKGGNGGSVVIPYRPDQSWLMFYINTDTNKGVVLTPTMPYNSAPLSDAEYNTLKDWITSGAPNEDGVVAFSGDDNRKKFYVANQGCDLITVFDANTLLAMRYIDAGITDQVETPHQLKVSPDGQYWYACFVAGTIVQKFRASDDSYVGSVDIGTGSWNTMAITHDGKKAFVVDFEDNGRIAYVDLENLALIQIYQGNDLFESPHGSWLDNADTTLYVTAEYGNFIYKINIKDPSAPDIEQVVIKPGQQPNTIHNSIDPHEIMLSWDESKYFVTCEASNEVRVMDTKMDTLLAAIPVGVFPVEMTMSKKYPYLFVTCMEDPCSEPLCKGSVYVIDYNTLQVVTSLQSGLFQPHGIVVDDSSGIVVVSSRNINPDGPAPHHVSDCGGRNGYLKFIDLNTLTFIPGYRPEVSVDPYSVAGRF